MATDVQPDSILGSDMVWYGPHQCATCGAYIVKAALEQGGQEFDPPELLMRVYLRGAESSNPAIVYPQTWVPHVHRSPSERIE